MGLQVMVPVTQTAQIPHLGGSVLDEIDLVMVVLESLAHVTARYHALLVALHQRGPQAGRDGPFHVGNGLHVHAVGDNHFQDGVADLTLEKKDDKKLAEK